MIVGEKIVKEKRHRVFMAFDLSMASLSGAALGEDRTLKKDIGPVWMRKAWPKDTDYYDRLRELARGHEFALDLIAKLKLFPEHEYVYIAVEEPFPFGLAKKMFSSTIKQQSQINGAFTGALLRYGFQNIREVNSQSWKSMVAFDLDMKMSKKAGFDKFAVKDWCRAVYPDMPRWKDLIRTSKDGLVHKPKSSVAQPVQPDDRYDSTAMMHWLIDEVAKEQGEL